MKTQRRSPGTIILGLALVLILIAESVLLVWFVQTRVLQTAPADETLSNDPPEENQPAQPLPDTPDVPDAPDTPEDTVDQAASLPQPDAELQPDETQPDETQPDETQPDETQRPGSDDPYGARVEELLAEMTLWEKVCQMFVITPESLTGSGTVTQAGEQTRQALADYPVGGLVYFADNLQSSEQVRSMISNTQSYSELGLLIAVDEEGGVVNRLMNTLGTTHFDSMYFYKDDGAQTAHDNAQTIGSDIASYGFNTDFAPVADVWSNPNNTVIGYRAYSDDFEQAAELVAAAVEGFHDAGTICTLKHFPGHGDTAEDSHYSSAYVDKTKAELEQEEWLSFQAGIDAGADMVMVGHLIVPALDDVPATISQVMITDILRGELGFDGVVITDSLEMSGISSTYSSGELAVRAIEAGVDLLLEPVSFRAAVNGVMDAVENGRLSEERIEESVRRILTLKLKYGILA